MCGSAILWRCDVMEKTGLTYWLISAVIGWFLSEAIIAISNGSQRRALVISLSTLLTCILASFAFRLMQ